MRKPDAIPQGRSAFAFDDDYDKDVCYGEMDGVVTIRGQSIEFTREGFPAPLDIRFYATQEGDLVSREAALEARARMWLDASQWATAPWYEAP